MGAPAVHWIDPRRGTSAVLERGLEDLERNGAGILRGRGTPARRTLTKVAASLPDGVAAYRIPEPSDPDVTTLIIHREGDERPVGFWGGDIARPVSDA